MVKNNKSFTADDIEDLLRNRFSSPAYAFIPQVRNGTGYLHSVRTVDALAMSLWPSRGLYLNGFEIKIYRNDWINELRLPQKAEEIAQFCDFWWIAAPKDIVKIEELPDNWGLMIPFGTTTKVIKEAKQLNPNPLSKIFLAAILRRVQECIAPQSKIEAAEGRGKEEGRKLARNEFKFQLDEFERLKEAIKKFESASGVCINTWYAEDIGEAVRIVLNGEHLRVKESLKDLLKRAKSICESIEKQLEDIK